MSTFPPTDRVTSRGGLVLTQSSQVKSVEEQDFVDVNKCAQNGDVPIMRSFRSVSRKNTCKDSMTRCKKWQREIDA